MRYTPSTIEWAAALSVEQLLLKDPVHIVPWNGSTSRAKYFDTEIDKDLAPVFVFIDTETQRPMSLSLETVCQLTRGEPN